MTAEGDEQILALNTPGEVLGLEAFGTGAYASDVIAVQSVVCCELPLRVISDQSKREGELDLGSRFAKRELDGRQFALGLSRREIANLLDTRFETVSRTLQELHREQAIRVRGGKVSLLSLTASGPR